MTSKSFIYSIVVVGSLYIIWVIIQHIKNRQKEDDGDSTDYTYMYESDDYDYKDYTSDNEQMPRDFEYNKSLSGHYGHQKQPKAKKD